MAGLGRGSPTQDSAKPSAEILQPRNLEIVGQHVTNDDIVNWGPTSLGVYQVFCIPKLQVPKSVVQRIPPSQKMAPVELHTTARWVIFFPSCTSHARNGQTERHNIPPVSQVNLAHCRILLPNGSLDIPNYKCSTCGECNRFGADVEWQISSWREEAGTFRKLPLLLLIEIYRISASARVLGKLYGACFRTQEP